MSSDTGREKDWFDDSDVGLLDLRCRADVLLGARTGLWLRDFKQCALLKSEICGNLYDGVGLNVLRCRADVLLGTRTGLFAASRF